MKVAFLDRDGTINRDYPDAEWAHIKEPEILDGALDGMRFLLSKGYQIIIVTNQYIIRDGIITHADYAAFTEKLLCRLNAEGVAVLDVFYCPHRKTEGCGCCKPKPGMVLAACEKYPEIDLSESLVAGDSEGDSEGDRGLAESLGLPFYGVGLDCENRIESLRDLKRYLAAHAITMKREGSDNLLTINGLPKKLCKAASGAARSWPSFFVLRKFNSAETLKKIVNPVQ